MKITELWAERDSAGWNLPPEEVQRRRNMFWELYTYDAWTVSQSLLQ